MEGEPIFKTHPAGIAHTHMHAALPLAIPAKSIAYLKKTHPAGIEPASTTPRRGSPPWNIQVLITQSSLVVLRVQPSSYARRLDLCGYYGHRTRLIFWSDNPVATPSSPSIQQQ
jgi:hypothetical protein